MSEPAPGDAAGAGRAGARGGRGVGGSGGARGGGGPSGGAGAGPSAAGAPAPVRRRPVASFLSRLLKEQPLGAGGGLIVLALVFITIFAAQLAPYEFDRGRVQDRMQGPSAAHLLGTDHVGRDFLSRLIIGARLSITVGLAATVLNLIVALLIGGTTGFIGGRLDIYAQRFVDAWMSFPGLLLLLTIMSIAGRGVVQIILVLGVAGGIPASRVVRGAVIGVKENAYFQAAEATGARTLRTLVRHVLPNIAAPLIVVFSINVGGRDHRRGVAELPRLRPAGDRSELGRHAEPRGPPVHGDCAAAGAVAGPVSDGDGLRPQPVRRRAARPAGPAPARCGRPLRGRAPPTPHAAAACGRAAQVDFVGRINDGVACSCAKARMVIDQPKERAGIQQQAYQPAPGCAPPSNRSSTSSASGAKKPVTTNRA